MLPCPDCNNPLTQFPIERDDLDLVSCDSCFGEWLVHPGDDLVRVDNVSPLMNSWKHTVLITL